MESMIFFVFCKAFVNSSLKQKETQIRQNREAICDSGLEFAFRWRIWNKRLDLVLNRFFSGKLMLINSYPH